MPPQLAASQTIEAWVSGARRSRGAIWFAIGFAAATALTIAATLQAVSGAGLAQPVSPWITICLAASLAICVVLAGILAFRIYRIRRASSASATGARLHLKFAGLFSLAAVVPAIAVALFMGTTLTQGIERWFVTQVGTVVESGADVGRYLVDQMRDTNREEVRLMASDLNQAAAGLSSDPATYRRYLAAQADNRSMIAAYIIDRSGHVLASYEAPGAPVYQPPSPAVFVDASRNAIADRMFEPQSLIRALTRLNAYPNNVYLYVVRPIDPTLLRRTRAFDDSVAAYRMAESRRQQIQTLFAISYLAIALLVLLGAVWLGLSFATQIAEPVGRLADAARRVAAGDLKARVPVGAEANEVEALAGAFNQMTAQLEAQTRDLVAAQEDAETRSRFIEAVLGGVSAGVLGLDRDGRVSAANRSAAQLLGHGDEDLVGRRLVDVAPELAELLNHPTPHDQTPPQRVDLERENFSANLSVRMSPDAEGGLVLTFDDMTKLISAQRQEAWKDVARRIAHEIKNPLTPIQLSAERLRRKYSSEITSDVETFQKCTDTILRQVADIGRMVDEFSSFARMPTPRMAFADMSEIARSTVFGQRLAFADIRFDVEGVEKPVALVCDERLIAQALFNLVKNAAESVQARRARDGEPKNGFVTLKLRDLEYGVQFEVIDNGLGFPAQDRHRLIEPYVTTRARGAGLGLAIVARIVEDHGGLIELDDAAGPGPGAVVRFVLPKRGEEPVEPAAEVGEGAL
ncbi:MAG TPA: PAS domain-containing sensor histidine kinase [Caulobacterales bacterium]|nr:PAS domain-containing sensor histidine kinase [Caulobacterales bacterium]